MPNEAPAADAPAERFEHVDVDLIHEAPDNPRTDFGDLDSLVASIREVGVLEPVLVVEGMPDGVDHRLGCEDLTNYTLVAGARRLRASRMAGLSSIPTVVRIDAPADAERLAMMLIENLQREDLGEFDEATAYERLVGELGWKVKDVAERVGRSHAHVSKRRALLKLPENVRAAIGAPQNPITLAEAYKLTELVDDPDRLKHAFDYRRHGPNQVERAATRLIEERKNERAHAKAVAELEAAGVTLVPSNFRWASGDNTEDLEYLGLDEEAHRAEPCSAAFVSARGAVTWMCNDVTRHAPDGKSKLKATIEAAEPGPEEQALTDELAGAENDADIEEIKARIAAAEEERKAKAAERAAAEAEEDRLDAQRSADTDTRRAFISNLLATGKPSKPAVADLFAAVLVRSAVDEYVESPNPGLACDLLGLEHDDTWGEKTSADAVLGAWAAGGLPQRQRAGLAVALAATEGSLGGRYNNVPPLGDAEPFFEFLGLHGYALTETDQASLDKARADAAEDQVDDEEPPVGDPATNGQAAEHEAALAAAGLTQSDLDGEVLDDLRGRLELACKAKKSKKSAAAIAGARVAFADALANTHPDAELAAAGVSALIVGYRSEIGEDSEAHFDEATAFRTKLLAIIEACERPLHAELRDEVLDGEAITFDVIADTEPKLRVEDLLESYRRRAMAGIEGELARNLEAAPA